MKNRPTIFLDLDGVLVVEEQHFSNFRHEDWGCSRFDEKCVKVFNEICDRTNPIIILSSDWQHHYNIEVLNNIFKWNNVNCEITDVTGTAYGDKFTNLSQLEECRAYDIVQYAKKHKIKNYVAIDDLDLKHWLDGRFVHTPRAFEGIKQSGVKNKVYKILNIE